MAEEASYKKNEHRALAVSEGPTSHIIHGDRFDTTNAASLSRCQASADEDDGHVGVQPLKQTGITTYQNTKTTSSNKCCGAFSLPVDIISKILLFSDFESAVKLAHLTCRDPSSSYSWVWKEMFDRQGFAPSANNQEKPNHSSFLEETKYRRRLLRNLTSPTTPSRSSINSFALPHSCFRFVPIRPDNDERYFIDDTPPVNFDCESFLLTTPTQAEYLSFNLFSGKLVVYPSILTDALAPQDFVLPNPHSQVDLEKQQRRTTVLHDNHSLSLTLHDYGFQPTSDNVNLEIEIVHLGVECKHTEAGRTVVALGQQLVNVNLMMAQQQNATNTLVTEVKSWERQQGQGDDFGSARICRFRHGFHSMELDELNLQLFVNPEKEEPNNRGTAEIGSTLIHVYPLVPYHVEGESNNGAGHSTEIPSNKSGDSVDRIAHYFPSPITTINCGEAVTTLACSGESLLVATSKGKLQLYEKLHLKHTFSVAEAVLAALQQLGRRNKEQSEMILRTTAATTAPIYSIRLVPHLSLERHGFVTLQHDDALGNTLLLWMPCAGAANTASTNTGRAHNKKMSMDDRSDQETGMYYQVDSVIQLPLLPHRIPKFHYDGRRLIVYGQDHIGFILLVYKIRSPDDVDDHGKSYPERTSNDGSGAGIMVSNRLEFTRRIRHAALGGHLNYEKIYLSCNDRFIVVNTKMAHEFVETRFGFGAEGLLVIDLEHAGTTSSKRITRAL